MQHHAESLSRLIRSQLHIDRHAAPFASAEALG